MKLIGVTLASVVALGVSFGAALAQGSTGTPDSFGALGPSPNTTETAPAAAVPNTSAPIARNEAVGNFGLAGVMPGTSSARDVDPSRLQDGTAGDQVIDPASGRTEPAAPAPGR